MTANVFQHRHGSRYQCRYHRRAAPNSRLPPPASIDHADTVNFTTGVADVIASTTVVCYYFLVSVTVGALFRGSATALPPSTRHHLRLQRRPKNSFTGIHDFIIVVVACHYVDPTVHGDGNEVKAFGKESRGSGVDESAA